jgi:hypothetical protein
MIDGLASAKPPGPLIMVVAFVGFRRLRATGRRNMRSPPVHWRRRW